jgi:tight adherence protein B
VLSQLASLNPQAILIVLMVAGVTVLVIVTIAMVLGAPRARMKKRIAAVISHGPAIALDTGSGDQSKKLQGSKRKVAEKLKEAESEGKKRRGALLEQALIHAGLTMRPKKFLILSALSGLILTGLVWATGVHPMFLLAAAPIGALGIPKLVLGFMIKRRLHRFTALFADAIDVIVRGVRSGLTVGECLTIVSREMPQPVGTEFALVNEGTRLGMTMAEVLQRLSDRVPTPEVRFFTIVLITQQSTGGNLAETLAKLSDVLRQRKKMKDKVQALSSEAKASAAIIGSLPFIMIAGMSFTQPKMLALLFTHPTGHVMLGIGVGMMITGMLVMRKMINFDF